MLYIIFSPAGSNCVRLQSLLCSFRDDHPDFLFEKILVHLLLDSEVRLLAMVNPQWRSYIVSYFKIPRSLIYRCKIESFLATLPLYIIAKERFGFELSKCSKTNTRYARIACPEVFTKMLYSSTFTKDKLSLTKGAWMSGNPEKNLTVKLSSYINPEKYLLNVFKSHNLGVIMYGLSVCPPVEMNVKFIKQALKSGDVDILNLTLSLCPTPIRYFNIAYVFWSGSKTLLDYVIKISQPNSYYVLSFGCAILAIKNDQAEMLENYFDKHTHTIDEINEIVWLSFFHSSINCLRFLFQRRVKPNFLESYGMEPNRRMFFNQTLENHSLSTLQFLIEDCNELIDEKILKCAMVFASYEQLMYLKQFITPDMDLEYNFNNNVKRGMFIDQVILSSQNKRRKFS